ncbi:uncharacterized protein LOC100164977 [Acyrthosiphon pisum]|uniref:BTB domain-containing protein n=1 Tax=Acyrthosiphon pisum TaxID=7029 RepID=A0A8R2D5L6_ACYPI|nr:uncharacterized protein LOC100164977 [Acyrthosiphon pisum]XP_008186385.1 uncharacterized protein LOC100164977 [Acyrthosiphon pisum]XP_016662648.1 uncharacterized protein LOC100164977 [Acyrthosiphon pisum]|eukprot:XP_001943732.1 PREDICTED: uncharacterized protein LOC100164977 [Acyrthosiphon pisum]
MGNPTRFMVSWDDHSTHLVARLGYLLERQQLVDVTLMCNTHSLKVHRSVLAACSPYFERELGNHPMIVLKDMKFSVLKSLIEFMYCGETNVTEDNLHALVEAAKFFEVKGLSSLAHESLQDSKSIKPPSLVCTTTAQTRICQVSSSPIPVSPIATKVTENGNYSSSVSVIARLGQNNNTNERRPCAGRGRPKAHLQSPCCEPLVSKPAPITPPQTESAQILLSLAGSNQSYISPSKHRTNDSSMATVNHEFPMSNGLDNNNPKFSDDIDLKYKRSRKRPADSVDENRFDVKKSMPNDMKTDEDVNRSPLLASLLTKNDKSDEKLKVSKPQETQTQSSERYINALKGAGLPTDIPILIENGDGNYITLTENVYDILAKEDALHFQITDNMNLANLKQPEDMVSNMQDVAQSNIPIIDTNIEDPILRNIKSHMPPDNPDDVVLYKVADDGNIEKYVLTTEDIKAFKESMDSNPERKKDSPRLSVSEINVPIENKSLPLITKILDCGNEKFSEALLGRLPLRKRGTFKINSTSSDTDMLQQMNNVCTQSVGTVDTDVEYVVIGEDSVQMDILGSTSISNKNDSLKNTSPIKIEEDVAEEEMSVLEAMMNNTIEFSTEDGDYQMHSSEEVFSNDQNDNEKMILSNVLMCTGAENSNSHVGLDHFGFKTDDVDSRNGDCNQQKKSKMYVDLDMTGNDFISEPVTEEVVLSSELNPSS